MTDALLPILVPAGGPHAVIGWSMGGYRALLPAAFPGVAGGSYTAFHDEGTGAASFGPAELDQLRYVVI